MNTRIRTTSLLAVALGALALSSTVFAGLPGPAQEKLRAQGEQRKNNEQRQAEQHTKESRGHAQHGSSRPPASRAPVTVDANRRGAPKVGSGRDVWNNNRNDGHHKSSHRPPRFVTTLPVGHRHYNWNGSAYYHHAGHWYRPYGTRYMVVGPPRGLFVSYLPGYHSSFWYGGARYFYSDSTYYLYEPVRRGYVVTGSPYVSEGKDEYAGGLDEDLYIYPAQGQSEQQQADDRYECHRWAVEETGYDPIESDYSAGQRQDYLRAMTACLTGRGYSVR